MARKTMGDPDYVYKTRSAAEREKRSVAARESLGIPPGHRRLYGIVLREEEYQRIKPIVDRLLNGPRKKLGRLLVLSLVEYNNGKP